MLNSKSTILRSRAMFATRLKRMRIDAGLTQKDLERTSGIPKSRISRYENGHLLPSFQGLRKLAQSLGVSDSALLADIDAPYGAFVSELRRQGVEFATVEEAEDVARSVAEAVQREQASPAPHAVTRR